MLKEKKRALPIFFYHNHIVIMNLIPFDSLLSVVLVILLLFVILVVIELIIKNMEKDGDKNIIHL